MMNYLMDSLKFVMVELHVIVISSILLMPLELILMILGGIGGGIIGKSVSRRLSGTTVDKLFIALQTVIIMICVYNAAKFM